MAKLEYSDFRPVRKGDEGYSPTARKYISPSTGEVISLRQFQKAAHGGVSFESRRKAEQLRHEFLGAPKPRQYKSKSAASVEQPKTTQPKAKLPQFAESRGGRRSYAREDTKAFGKNSSFSKDMKSAVRDFVSDRGGSKRGLSREAQQFLNSPSISAVFDKYWVSGGFKAGDVLGGMQNVYNIQITEGDDGDIEVDFDYDADVGDYVVSGHAHA